MDDSAPSQSTTQLCGRISSVQTSRLLPDRNLAWQVDHIALERSHNTILHDVRRQLIATWLTSNFIIPGVKIANAGVGNSLHSRSLPQIMHPSTIFHCVCAPD
ncbi:unnamed protein product [Periconia digitata]|uniref:Uncharacterized protein n=1 Tax=Periconia digitata TaxID=1303443 RepID=A0A9W4UKV7_9PLEO|nr:unnamed protein product [Periconia digitata]